MNKKTYVRNCEICNNEFTTTYSSKLFCNVVHNVSCEFCGKEFEMKSKLIKAGKRHVCSNKECQSKLRSESIKGKKKVFKEKKCENCGELFSGPHNQTLCDNPECREILMGKLKADKEESRLNNRIKISCPICNTEFYPKGNQVYCKESHTATCSICGEAYEKNSHYYDNGLDLCFKTECRAEYMRLQNQEKYGVDNQFQLAEVKEKIAETLMERYGVTHPMHSEKVKEKVKKTVMGKYGVSHLMKDEHFLLEKGFKIMSDGDLVELAKSGNGDKKFTKRELEKAAGYKNLSKTIHDLGISNQIEYVISYKEKAMRDFLTSLNVKFTQNDRSVISPLEVDFYLPDYKLAIEISPTSTHNSMIGIYGGEPKSRDYHISKFLKCQESGVDLITIFDWHSWAKICEMIAHRTHDSKVVFARKTLYDEVVLRKEIRSLFNDWHVLSLPKNVPNGITSILRHANKIVGLALWTPTSRKNTIELKRMVFAPGYSVPGGASKIVKNFIKNHNEYEKVITYSDCDLGSGNVYSAIGFKLIEESMPQLNFYNEQHEWHIRNLSLIMQGADRMLKKFPNYKAVGVGGNLPSNQEIVIQYGFLPVYDCGYRKWEFVI